MSTMGTYVKDAADLIVGGIQTYRRFKDNPVMDREFVAYADAHGVTAAMDEYGVSNHELTAYQEWVEDRFADNQFAENWFSFNESLERADTIYKVPEDAENYPEWFERLDIPEGLYEFYFGPVSGNQPVEDQ